MVRDERCVLSPEVVRKVEELRRLLARVALVAIDLEDLIRGVERSEPGDEPRGDGT